VALGVTPLRVGEAYWLDHIARNACEYYAGKGESPGWWLGSLAERAGLQGEASEEAVHRLFAGQDPTTGEQRVAPAWRSDPRSKLPAGPLQAALRELAAARGVETGELAAGIRARRELQTVLTARGKLGVAVVEHVCRMVLGRNPEGLYGEAFAEARKQTGRRVDARVASFDLSLSDPKSVSPLAAGSSAEVRAEVNRARRGDGLLTLYPWRRRPWLAVAGHHNQDLLLLRHAGLLPVAWPLELLRLLILCTRPDLVSLVAAGAGQVVSGLEAPSKPVAFCGQAAARPSEVDQRRQTMATAEHRCPGQGVTPCFEPGGEPARITTTTSAGANSSRASLTAAAASARPRALGHTWGMVHRTITGTGGLSRTLRTCQLPREMLGTSALWTGFFLTQKRLNDWHAHDSEVLRQEAVQDSGSWRDPGICGPGVTAARQPVQSRAWQQHHTNRCPEVQTLS
jgi:hypothetical protein